MDYKYIYLVFSKTGTWLSKTINIFSETKYVHASLSFDDTFTKMYSFGRKNPSNPFSGGLVEENLYDGVYKRNPESECLIYRVRITSEQYYCLKRRVEDFLNEKNKYRYNFLGLFGVLINRPLPLKRKNHYFCSQFVSEVLINENVYESSKMPELIRTTDLFSVKNKEVIYEGFINKYYTANHLSNFI